MEQDNSIESFEGSYLNARLDTEAFEVEIIANEPGLRYLRYILNDLIVSGSEGSHYHLDRVTGLTGTIRQLVITRMSPIPK